MQVMRKHQHFKSDYILYGSSGILLAGTILTGFLLSSAPSGATTANHSTYSTATVNVSASCSMTVDPNETDTPHTATLPNGVYSGGSSYYPNGIGTTTMQVFCNDPNGYAIYAIGFTGGQEGIDAHTNTVLHSSTLGSTYDIATGTATSAGTQDVSNWAMKLSSVAGDFAPTILSDTSGSYSSFHAVPADYTKVASFGNQTDTEGGVGSSLTTTYAAYISGTQPAGTYQGQVKYVLVHPSSRPNPTILSMQEVDDWATELHPGEEITTFDERDNKEYKVARICLSGTNANCASSMLWMTQNLDLDLSSTRALTSNDTDLNVALTTDTSGAYSAAAGYTEESGVIYWTPARNTIDTSISETQATTITGWSNSQTSAYSMNPGDWYIKNTVFASSECYLANQSYAQDQTCNYITKPSGSPYATYFTTDVAQSDVHRHLGNYYNWSAAIASNNSGTLGVATTPDTAETTPLDIAQNSICPKGWRLPTMAGSKTGSAYSVPTATNEFAQLNTALGGSGANLIDATKGFYAVRAGYVNNGSLGYAGYYGYYWSSTAYSSSGAYYLSLRSDCVYPADGSSRSGGWSVRCVSEAGSA